MNGCNYCREMLPGSECAACGRTSPSSLAAPAGSAMGVEQLIVRLATRGLLPCEHNLQIWQHADNAGWGAAVETPYKSFQAEAHGETLQAALEGLMRETNRGADISPNEKGQP